MSRDVSLQVSAADLALGETNERDMVKIAHRFTAKANLVGRPVIP